MKLRFLSLSSLLMLAAPAAVLAQSVLGVTPTQAVLHYQASGPAPCQVQVSQNRTMTPLAADVDPVLFPGSNLDNRAGSVSSGSDRSFIVGKRRADLASDGKHYSRALQAFTEYFYQITCGTSVQSGRFVTTDPPLGNTFPEPPPFDATGFGNYAWPTIDWNDQSKSYIDPMTGILIKRATGPGWYGQSQSGKTFSFAMDLNNAWTNAANILSGNGTSVANYSGAGGDPIFVALPGSQVTGSGGNVFGGWYPGQTLDNLMIRIFGTGNATISGCLSDDSGAHCVSPAFDMAALGASGGSPAGTFPTACGSDLAANCFPNNGFWGGWNFTPISWQMSSGSGTVNVAGSAVTSGQYTGFNLNWKTGGKVMIAGSAPACPNNLCTINYVNSSSSMTIFENPGTLTGVQFQTANTGVVLWVKKTGGTSSASISVNFDYAYSDQFTMPFSGTLDQCSPNPTTVSYAADGVTPITPVQGELCLAAHGNGPMQALYLLIPSTGETRFLAPIWLFNGGDQAVDQVAYFQMLGAGFDATDPNTFYGQSNTSGGLSVFRGVYNAAQYKYKTYPHSLYPSATNSYQPGQDTAQYWFHGGPWSDTGIAWSNITKASQGKDLGSQIAANNPSWDPSIFLGPGVTHVGNGRAFTGNGPVGFGETLNLVNSFDLSTGNIVQEADSWSKFPSRWCGAHSNVELSGWYGLVCNPLGGAYGFGGNPGIMGIGPWQMTPTAMLKGGSFVSDTSMTVTSPRDACPTIPAFLASIVPANPACVTFQSQMACSHTPHPLEKTKWPCEYNANWSELQKIAPGDGLLVITGPGTAPETLLIISVTGLGNANYQFTAVRGSTGIGLVAAPTAWVGYAVPPTTRCNISNCTPGIGVWFSGLAAGVTWQLDPGAFSGHSDLGSGPTPGADTFCQTTVCRFNIPMAQQIGSFANSKSFADNTFAGVGGAIALQGYPSVHQVSAPPSEKVWMLNFRHINPSLGSGAEVQSPVGPVTYNQVAGTLTVFRFTSINGGLNYKVVPVTAYAGYHLLKDVSGPAMGNVITDATPWNYCVVLKAGECQVGSAVGEVYMAVPHGVLRGDQNCVSNWYDDNFPCVFTSPPQAAWVVQQDISRDDPNGTNWRRITMGLSGPGRQFQFGTVIPDPTGTWVFMQGYWPDGVRNDLLMARLPAWPNPRDVTTNRSHLESQAVQIAASANQPNARIRFGYAENGPVASYNCTPRNETCVTGGSPYSFISENPAWQSCAGGCTIQIPAIPGRILFYAIDRQDGSGNIVSGNTQIAVMK